MAVLAYSRGEGTVRASKALGYAPSTAIGAVRRYLRDGRAGLTDRRKDNGGPKIVADLFQALAEILSKHPADLGSERPTWTRELLALTLDQLGVAEVGVTTVSRALARLRGEWEVAKPIVGCPWSARRREERLRQIRRLAAHRR